MEQIFFLRNGLLYILQNPASRAFLTINGVYKKEKGE